MMTGSLGPAILAQGELVLPRISSFAFFHGQLPGSTARSSTGSCSASSCSSAAACQSSVASSGAEDRSYPSPSQALVCLGQIPASRSYPRPGHRSRTPTRPADPSQAGASSAVDQRAWDRFLCDLHDVRSSWHARSAAAARCSATGHSSGVACMGCSTTSASSPLSAVRAKLCSVCSCCRDAVRVSVPAATIADPAAPSAVCRWRSVRFEARCLVSGRCAAGLGKATAAKAACASSAATELLCRCAVRSSGKGSSSVSWSSAASGSR